MVPPKRVDRASQKRERIFGCFDFGARLVWSVSRKGRKWFWGFLWGKGFVLVGACWPLQKIAAKLER